MDTLDVVIIVCVAIGALALCFVVFILFWAWRYDRRNRDQYRSDGPNNREKAGNQSGSNGGPKNGNHDGSVSTFDPPPDNSQDRKNKSADSEEAMKMSYPTEIGLDDNGYPESVMSEDINSSMLMSKESGESTGLHGGNALDGVGSVSSMDVESYGYSIEAPSMMTNTNTVSDNPYGSSMSIHSTAGLSKEAEL
mmetsp:Transcript_18450/g.23753  ORF Transcript_18450/g.23753 Transcript_18450/m.23753 type:complete len:194 (-) Transcript_18450:278-859(-)